MRHPQSPAKISYFVLARGSLYRAFDMPLAHTIRQHFSLLLIPPVMLSAFFSGRALMDIAGSLLLAPSAILAAHGAVVLPPTKARERTVADAILARNPFDSVTGALRPPGDAPPGPLGAPACEGVRVHVIVASREPGWSFASFSLAGDDKTVIRRRGGILDRKDSRHDVVRFIGARSVWLSDRDERLCEVAMFDEKPLPPPVTTTTVSPSPGPGKQVDPVIAHGIERVSATEYRVDRGVLEKILEEQAELLKGTAIGPERENGRVVGVRLLGIRPGSVLALLGLESGDRLTTLNGFEMSDPEKMLEAYATLRTAPRLMLNVTRGGKPMEIDYAIR
ncbi:MAG: type II secretion system protein GspC [Polyangiaceae bacterium]